MTPDPRSPSAPPTPNAPPSPGGSSPDPRHQRVEDDGLRRMLIYTLVALVVSLVMALIGVTLAVRYFDRP
jgi:hypothetical protein